MQYINENTTQQSPTDNIDQQVAEIKRNLEEPDDLTLNERKVFFQTEDIRQAYIAKHRKNEIEARTLIPASEVEMVLGKAFKSIALLLDTLPDNLERDGIIKNSDIDSVIKIIDNSRGQLATELSELSPECQLMNMLGDY